MSRLRIVRAIRGMYASAATAPGWQGRVLEAIEANDTKWGAAEEIAPASRRRPKRSVRARDRSMHPLSVEGGVSNKNLVWAVIDRLFLTVYGLDDPTDQEWDAYLRTIEQHGIVRTMQIVITDGAAPTKAQRRRLERLVAGHEVPVAVLSESTAVRVMVSAFAKLNRRLRAFSPADLAEALAFLQVPNSRIGLIEQEIIRLRRSLGQGGET
jgi:hypothetical protein